MTERSLSPDSSEAEALINALEEPAKAQILSVLIAEAGHNLNPSKICKRADIDLEAFYDHIDELCATGLVYFNYTVGNGPSYEINRQTLATSVESLPTLKEERTE